MSADVGAKGKRTALFSGVGALTAVYLKFQGAILAAIKAGGLLKFAWIFKSCWTMFLSLGLYTMAFGWRFGACLVLLLLVHEGGHWIWMKAYGLDPKAPVFIPFLGAYVAMNKLPADEATHAWVAYGGPFVGGLGALALYLIGAASNTTWLMAAGSAGFLLNLFQLVPAKPLDGGFIVGAISKWFLLIGFVLLVVLAICLQSFILILITIFSARSLYGQFFKKQGAPQQIYSGGAKTVKELEEILTKPEAQVPEATGNSAAGSSGQKPAANWQKFAIGAAYIALTVSLASLYSYATHQVAAKKGWSNKFATSGGASGTTSSSANEETATSINKDYSNGVKEKPDSWLLYGFRSETDLKSQSYKQAVDDCSEAIELFPQSPSFHQPYFVYLNRGEAYFRLGQYQNAIKDCSKAIELTPACADAFYYRAQAYEKLNKRDLANKDLSQANELGYESADK